MRIDPDRLVAHNVSTEQVVDAVHNSNIIESPGLIEENHQLELVLISGQAKKPEELNSIVVAMVNNAPVTLADVATVGAGVEPEYTMVTADGHPAALVNINRQPDANTVAVADEVRQTLASMRGQIPADVHIAAYYDQSSHSITFDPDKTQMVDSNGNPDFYAVIGAGHEFTHGVLGEMIPGEVYAGEM